MRATLALHGLNKSMIFWLFCTPFQSYPFMRAIARAHASTRATSLMRVKKAHASFIYGIYRLRHRNEEIETLNIKLNS